MDLVIEFLVDQLAYFKIQQPNLKMKKLSSKKSQEQFDIIVDILKRKNVFDKISKIFSD